MVHADRWWYPEGTGDADDPYCVRKTNINMCTSNAPGDADPVMGTWLMRDLPCRLSTGQQREERLFGLRLGQRAILAESLGELLSIKVVARHGLGTVISKSPTIGIDHEKGASALFERLNVVCRLFICSNHGAKIHGDRGSSSKKE